MIAANKSGFFPYTPAANMLFGLREAIRMLQEEGLYNVFARHARLLEATRRAGGTRIPRCQWTSPKHDPSHGSIGLRCCKLIQQIKHHFNLIQGGQL